jgi:phosphopantothenate-cysteine ligase
MDIIITAGGTSEYIDKVRKITNMSTGALGSNIAATLLEKSDHYIIFLGSDTAITKLLIEIDGNMLDRDFLEFHHITDTNSLDMKMTELLTKREIGCVIHSMAVSDYTVGRVFSNQNIIDLIENSDMDKNDIVELLKNPPAIDNTNKISSSFETMDIRLIKTPKVIDKIKVLSPKTILIGFKLLNGVDHSELIDVARKSLVRTKSDFIIANDLAEIKECKTHVAYLVDMKSEVELTSKQNISNKILEIVNE